MIRSAVILEILILLTVIFDRLTDLEQTLQMIVYAIPFTLHIVFSIFVKRKESWLIGAIGCTLITMVIAVIIMLLII